MYRNIWGTVKIYRTSYKIDKCIETYENIWKSIKVFENIEIYRNI